VISIRRWLSAVLARWSQRIDPDRGLLPLPLTPRPTVAIAVTGGDGKREIHHVDPATVQFVAHVTLATLADIRAAHEAHAEEWRRLGEWLSGLRGGDAATGEGA
jgi:hypothetical protein